MADNEYRAICECGCGGEIVWTPPKRDPNRKRPRFISGHNCRVMKTKRPDPPPPNPFGKCLCGCNQPIPRAKQTSRGNVAGEFIRYLQGHHSSWETRRNPVSPDDPKGPNPSGRCLCGCGAQTSIADRTDPIKQTVFGCYMRFVRGHDKWKNRTAEVVNRTGICACGCGEKTPIAKRSSRGNIKGLPMLYVDQKHAQRSTHRVDEATGCWLLPYIQKDGYTRIRRNNVLYLGHVWYWMERFGPVPKGMELDHKCRNRACVNPEHLEAVSHMENMRRTTEEGAIPHWKGTLDYTVDEKSGCWNFAVLQPNGYGLIWKDGSLVTAHLLAYQRVYGNVPEGLELDHLCSNPGCCNPDHLEAVTHTENVRRAAARREKRAAHAA